MLFAAFIFLLWQRTQTQQAAQNANTSAISSIKQSDDRKQEKPEIKPDNISQKKISEKNAEDSQPQNSATNKVTNTEQKQKTASKTNPPPSLKKHSIKPPNFQVIQIQANGKVRIAGFAPENWTIELRSFGKLIGSTKVKKQTGEWMFANPQNLKPDDYKIKLIAISPDGKNKILSDQLISFTILKSQDTQPKVVKTEDTKKPVVVQKEKKKRSTAKKSEPPTKLKEEKKENSTNKPKKNVAEPLLSIGKIEYQASLGISGKLIATGDAVPGAKLKVFLDEKLLGESIVNKTGSWLFRKDLKLKNGNYVLKVNQRNSSGRVISSAQTPYTLVLSTSAPRAAHTKPSKVELKPEKDAIAKLIKQDAKKQKRDRKKHLKHKGSRVIVVRRGDTLWDIAQIYYKDGKHYKDIFYKNRHKLEDPHCIYPGQHLVLPSK